MPPGFFGGRGISCSPLFTSSVPADVACQGILLGLHPPWRLRSGLLGTLALFMMIPSLCDCGCLFLFLPTLPLVFVQSFNFWDELATKSFILLSWVFLMRCGCIQLCRDIPWVIWSPHSSGLHEVVFFLCAVTSSFEASSSDSTRVASSWFIFRWYNSLMSLSMLEDSSSIAEGSPFCDAVGYKYV